MADKPFHFSPRANRAHEIEWREWGPQAFGEAKARDKPILLSLSAVWCHWCHVMDETSYSDPGVIAYINQHYVPVRVDNDERPDINARYNMGGWPTTAFLTPDGELMTGGTYIPPEAMLEHLPKIATQYKSNREEIAKRVTDVRQRRAAASATRRGELTADIFDNVVRAVVQTYDPVYGGFGEAPKFPHTEAIDLLLYAHRRNNDPDALHMARKTLELMSAGGLFDHEWGGFFRYATRRDWSEPHYEKMLEDNDGLLRVQLSLHRASSDAAHAAAASRVIEYLEAKLRDRERGYFYGSQDADEEFYKLSAAEREKREEPYIDRRCYTSWNAMAASAYLEASWTLDRPELREAALRALEFAWSELRRDTGGAPVMCRYHGGEARMPGLLTDQAHMARALLDAHEVSGDSTHLERALALAGTIVERFADPAGGFFDVWADGEGLGLLADRQKSVQDNAVCAEVLTRLHHLTREKRWLDLARAALEAFAPAYPALGQFAAGYARQVDLLLNPPAEINVVGSLDDPAAAALHRAALALELPARVVQVLDPRRDGERLQALFLPAEPAPAAYVCAGTTCSAPVSEPAALKETVAQMRALGVRELDLGGR